MVYIQGALQSVQLGIEMFVLRMSMHNLHETLSQINMIWKASFESCQRNERSRMYEALYSCVSIESMTKPRREHD